MTTTAARLDAGAAMATASIATKSHNPSQHLSKQISSWEGQDAYSEDHSSECTGSTTAIAMPALSPKVTLNDGYITLLMFQNDELTRRVDAIETTLSKHMHGLGADGLGNTSEGDGHDGTLSVAMQLDSKLSVAMQDFVAFRRQLELQLKQTVQRQDMKMDKLVDAVQGLTALVDNKAINAGDINPLTDTDETKETQNFADAMQGLNALVNQINGVANKAGKAVPLTDTFGPKEERADYANDDVCISVSHLDKANDALPNASGLYNASKEREERTIDECEARLLEVNGRLGNQLPLPDRTLNIEQTARVQREVPIRDARPSNSQLLDWKPPLKHSSAQCEAISAPAPSPCPLFATRTRSPRSPTRPARISHTGSLSEFPGKDREETRGQKINTVYSPIRRMQSCACSPVGIIPRATTPGQHVSLIVPSVNEVTRRFSAGSVQLPIRR